MAWAFVQGAGAVSATGVTTSSVTVTTANLTSGNRLLIAVGAEGSGSAPATITISDNTTGAAITYFSEITVATSGDLQRVSLFSANIPAAVGGTKPTFTATVSGTVHAISIAFAEYSGLATTAGVIADRTASTNGSTTTTAPAVGPTVATTAANELVVAVWSDCGYSQASVTAGSGLTNRVTQINQTLHELVLSDKDSGTSGATQSGSWTTSATAPYGSVLAVLKVSGVAAGPAPRRSPVMLRQAVNRSVSF